RSAAGPVDVVVRGPSEAEHDVVLTDGNRRARLVEAQRTGDAPEPAHGERHDADTRRRLLRTLAVDRDVVAARREPAREAEEHAFGPAVRAHRARDERHPHPLTPAPRGRAGPT